jgi:spore coat polysaccharide biosynthesis predicted glycosyltransferase SpsG/RimJ/RimL family protein N-acetyltransferase
MIKPEPLLIRADAGVRIGTGHVMRMLALAQAYQDRGGQVTMVCATCPESIADRVRREGIAMDFITAGEPGAPTDCQDTIGRARSLGARWVVLDGYHFHEVYQRALRAAGLRVLAVDDYGHCAVWAADAVLNQNIFAPELKYHSEVAGCRFLLGTRFALLRREFREETERHSHIAFEETGRRRRDEAHSIFADKDQSLLTSASAVQENPQPIRRLLVTLGGADPDNITGRLLGILNSLDELRLEIKVLVGGGNPHLEHLRQLAASSPHAIEVLHHVLDMPSLYHWAHGVISAGGSTCWEWLFYRLPAAVVCIADNQRPVVAGLVKHRLAVDLGWHENMDPVSVSAKLGDWLNRAAGQPSAPPSDLVVDALGADRIASVVDESCLWIRHAILEDCRLYFKWANDPDVRANAIHTEPIPWTSHKEWFERKLKSRTSHLYVANNLENIPVGQVRLDKTPDGPWEVDISVAKEWRSKGIGLRMLDLSLRVFWRTCWEPVCAQVKSQNAASANVFKTLGFRRIQDCEEGLLRFTLQP